MPRQVIPRNCKTVTLQRITDCIQKESGRTRKKPDVAKWLMSSPIGMPPMSPMLPMPTSIVLYENAAPSATITPKETVQEVVTEVVTEVVNDECTPAFYGMMTKGIIYAGNGKFGDFAWMIANGYGYQKGCVYLVNDNVLMFERSQELHYDNSRIQPGGGNAIIRTLEHYSQNLIVSVPTTFLSCDSIHEFHEYLDPTRNVVSEYECLQYEHKHSILYETLEYVCIRHEITACKMIDVAIERIVNFFIANPSMTLLYYARDSAEDILGLGIYQNITPKDVVQYITKKIKAVPNIVNHHRAKNAGMLGDEDVSLMMLSNDN